MPTLAQGGCGHPPLRIGALFRGDFFQFVNHCAVFGSTADTADIIGNEFSQFEARGRFAESNFLSRRKRRLNGAQPSNVGCDV